MDALHSEEKKFSLAFKALENPIILMVKGAKAALSVSIFLPFDCTLQVERVRRHWPGTLNPGSKHLGLLPFSLPDTRLCEERLGGI